MPKLINHLRDKNTQNMFLEVAYGLHIVEGDLCKSLTTDGDPFDIYVQHKLGHRQWNACKSLWWRGFAIPEADYSFHPGAISSGNSDPIQGVDAIFDMDIPHSQTAWMRAKLPQSEIQDINTSLQAPEGLYGIYETLLTNNYNSDGEIIGFDYSANPARIVADLFLILGRRSASRIDWGAWAEWHDFLAQNKLCDYSQIPKFQGFGLTASYYNGQSFGTLVQKRIDAVVEFLTSAGAPAYGLSVNDFSVRYEGKVKAEFDETYTIYLTANDGGRLWIDDTLIIDYWTTAGTHSTTIALEAGEFYDIKVEWKDGSGDAEVRLEWESASRPREVIPADRLYPKPENKPNFECHIAFTKPARLDDAIRAVLAQCNSTFQRVNGKYRFFCYDQLTAPTFTFDELSNFYPDSVEIEPLDLTQARNVWQGTCRDIESQYLEQIATPLSIELETLINAAGRRNDGDLLDFHNSTRWQAYRLLEARARRATALNKIRFRGNCETFPVLRGDRVSLNLEFLNLENYQCRVSKAEDLSSEQSADDRQFELQEWYNSSTLVPELVPDETAPTVPGSFDAVVISSSRIDLSWTPSTDARGVAGYEIEQNSTVIDVGLVLGVSRTALTQSTSYTFKVRAYDGAGNRSSWSDAVTESTPASSDTTPPTVPGSFSGSALNTTQISLAWAASTDDYGVAGYEIEQSGTVVNVGLVLGVTRSGLTPDTAYTFKVRAYDNSGNRSSWSSTLNISTEPEGSAPDTPSLSVISYDYYVDLNWSLVGFADGYELEEDGLEIDMGTALSDTRSPGGGFHTYRIRSYNAFGSSAWSDLQSVYLSA